MKGLTLTAPYGTLIAIAATHPDLGKHVETRGWTTAYRGTLAIHQAAGLGPVGGVHGLDALCETEPFRSALCYFGWADDPAYWLPRGKIVAVVDLADCWPTAGPRGEDGMGPKYADWVHFLTDQERAFGDYTPGRYGWILNRIRALRQPIPCRGSLGLWDVPADVEAQIARQLQGATHVHA